MKLTKIQTIIFLLGFLSSVFSNQAMAQSKSVVTVGGATPVVTVAHSIPLLAKYLGYIKNVDIEAKGFAGSTILCQQATMGTLQIISVASIPFIAGNVKEKAFNLLAFYNFRPRQTTYLAVLEESPIKGVNDLRGKKIGVQSFATDAIDYLKAMAQAEGFKESEMYTLLSTGIGMPAYTALKMGRIDALCLWDIEYANAENAGFKLRYFHDPRQQYLPSGSMVSTAKWVKENPKIVEEFGLGIAQATVFAMTNPEAAVKIYWKTVPGSKPTGVPEEKALKETAHVLKSHLIDLDPKPQKLRWGEFSEAWMQRYIDFLYAQKVIPERPQAKDFFTNQSVEKFNQFNEADVIKQANEFKM